MRDSASLQVNFLDVNKVILEMYESKIVKIVRKLPRSHLVLISALISFTKSKSGFVSSDLWVSETDLLNLYNRKAS